MSTVPLLLVALISISAIVAVMLGVAWHDLGRSRHARTWSIAFAVAALTWSVPFAGALGWLSWSAATLLMPGFAGFAAVTIAMGFRERAGLPNWRIALLGIATANVLLLLALRIAAVPVTWIVPTTALNAAMFGLSARTLRGRRRGERAAERVAETGLLLLALLNMLVFGGFLGSYAGLTTLRLEPLARTTMILLPVIIVGIGLFTIILLTADLADQTRRMAATDMLTGLLNRRGFEAAAEAVLAAVRRQGRSCALVLIDVDHFKRINDRFGHPAGDRVLRAICQRIGQGIGRRDIFARIGGEEFALILTDVDLQAATCAVEVLRAQLETLTFDLPEPCRVTASFGVAACDSRTEGLAALFLLADRALYRSKEGGRNRVTVAGTEPA